LSENVFLQDARPHRRGRKQGSRRQKRRVNIHLNKERILFTDVFSRSRGGPPQIPFKMPPRSLRGASGEPPERLGNPAGPKRKRPKRAPRAAKSAPRAAQRRLRSGLFGHLRRTWRPRGSWRLPGGDFGLHFRTLRGTFLGDVFGMVFVAFSSPWVSRKKKAAKNTRAQEHNSTREQTHKSTRQHESKRART